MGKHENNHMLFLGFIILVIQLLLFDSGWFKSLNEWDSSNIVLTVFVGTFVFLFVIELNKKILITFFRTLKNNIVFTVIIIILLITLLIASNIFVNDWFKELDNKERVAMLSVIFVGVGTLLTIIGNSIRQRQKLVAEQIAKSRVEWLGVTRGYVSNYMSYANQAWNKIRNRSTSKSDSSDSSDLDDILIKTEEFYYNSIYSVNPKEHIYTMLEGYLIIAEKNQIDPYLKSQLTAYLGQEVQMYFKNEWDKAKLEIETGTVAPNDTVKSLNYIKELRQSPLEEWIKLPVEEVMNDIGFTSNDSNELIYKFMETYIKAKKTQKS